MVEKIIEGQDGGPMVLKEKVSMTTTVVPVKFISNDHAEAFVRRHGDNQHVFYKYEDVWCSGNQIPEERV